MTQKIDREAVKKAFASYVAGYNADDPKIKLKIDHTYRVADLCDRIARTVPEVSPDLAWLSGMLHDVGRFEQIKRYNTFVDADSVDHAAFGADMLQKVQFQDTSRNRSSSRPTPTLPHKMTVDRQNSNHL